MNWLDTNGRHRGVIMLRYDGMTETTFDPTKYPGTTKVKLSELKKMLPEDTPALSPEQRRDEIASRRKHVQVRFGN